MAEDEPEIKPPEADGFPSRGSRRDDALTKFGSALGRDLVLTSGLHRPEVAALRRPR
jgi:hypothetical protein